MIYFPPDGNTFSFSSTLKTMFPSEKKKALPRITPMSRVVGPDCFPSKSANVFSLKLILAGCPFPADGDDLRHQKKSCNFPDSSSFTAFPLSSFKNNSSNGFLLVLHQ